MVKARAMLFVNGECNWYERLEKLLKPDDFLVAVDGGLKHIQKLHRVPNLLIGDLDSANKNTIAGLQKAGIEIQNFSPEKDETDLELALLEVVRHGYRKIFIIGGFGGRLDQTLANLSLLALPQLADYDVRLLDEGMEAFLIRNHRSIIGEKGDILSLLPLQGVVSGITTTGLKYSLKNETLLPEKSRGISNIMMSRKAEVKVRRGLLLCIYSHS